METTRLGVIGIDERYSRPAISQQLGPLSPVRVYKEGSSAKSWIYRRDYFLRRQYAAGWTTFKKCLVTSILTVFVYGTASLVCALLTWFRTWKLAGVMITADNDVLILVTMAGSIMLLTAIIGMVGTILNSRPILAVYAVLLWAALTSICVVGYISYKRSAFALDRKLNLSWSRYYTAIGRLLIQNSLHCCGYYTPLHEATQSENCNPSSQLPGCKASLYNFEQENLKFVWTIAFSIVPLHLVNIIVSLLCANHVTRTGTTLGATMNRINQSETGTSIELKGLLDEMECLSRPEMSRASSSGVFREDRKGRVLP
ncbi:hypothetical protein AMATHDRAFT_136172 [Amanita thiersii Skay4041]|uniref:Tetraspanin Tsp2 n=1 Tax=Amanita thiersii Skay4041 TaxID=703135 RepID=A0A2A9NX35_9AGAR|nr:hypothetical protein AMATHDRAFT_136172 [Amanita thiersii Skay4041]